MAATVSADEKANLESLPIAPEDLASGGGTNPFNKGRRIFKYRPSDLRFIERKDSTQRTKDFRSRLIWLAGQLGGRVPYAFRLSDGTLRSLDAGCLGFLYHRRPPEIAFDQDANGYIIGVRLRNGPSTTPFGQGAHYTISWLIARGMRPAMSMLIQAAQEGGVVTYGQLANRLRQVLSRPSISPRNMGFVAGALMDRILRVDPDAPLINLLVVLANSEQPGEGADSYIRRRFKIGRALGVLQRRVLVQRGLNEVWGYQHWAALFERVFSETYQLPVQNLKDDYDRDGQPDNPRHRGEPESAEHKALKRYVLAHPTALRLSLANPVGRLERDLLSGDRMDVEFIDGARRIGVEVKSIRSGWPDLRRGIYQCVKYRAVMVAQSGFDPTDARCEAVLVTEGPLPSDLRALARRLLVPHRIVRVN